MLAALLARPALVLPALMLCLHPSSTCMQGARSGGSGRAWKETLVSCLLPPSVSIGRRLDLIAIDPAACLGKPVCFTPRSIGKWRRFPALFPCSVRDPPRCRLLVYMPMRAALAVSGECLDCGRWPCIVMAWRGRFRHHVSIQSPGQTSCLFGL